jgi:hypothetical protein
MREYKSLAEWLESKGNPKHYIAEEGLYWYKFETEGGAA